MSLPPPLPPPASPPPTPPPAPPRAPAPPPPPVPVKGGNRTLIIVLCVIVGIVLLIGGCVSTCTYFAAKKAKEYARDAQRNPAYASLSLAAALHPDLQVLSKDAMSGKITLRNKKTGETVTIDTNDYTSENIGLALEKIARNSRSTVRETARNQSDTPAAPARADPAEEPATKPEPKISAGKAAAMTATLRKFPDYLPAYPGATTVESQLNNVMGMTMGNYAALTNDKTDDVLDYYEKKLTAAGYTIVGRNNDSNDNGPVSVLSATLGNPPRTVGVTATSESGGKVRVEITYAAMGK